MTVDDHDTAVSILRAAAALRDGGPVLVTLADHERSETSIIAAADRVTADTMAFIVRHSSGFVCVTMTDQRAHELDLPQLNARGRVSHCVAVDAADGITTGISAHDRAKTARLLASPETTGNDLSRPGHVVPILAAGGGIRSRLAIGEASTELARLARVAPTVVTAELVSIARPTTMADLDETIRFAQEHRLEVVDAHRLREVVQPDLAAHREPSQDEVNASMRSFHANYVTSGNMPFAIDDAVLLSAECTTIGAEAGIVSEHYLVGAAAERWIRILTCADDGAGWRVVHEHTFKPS
jgi:3,4-dihydroxy-2-butanone 4-phosphate synthase